MNPVLEILQFSVGHGFWHFIGCWILLGSVMLAPLHTIFLCWNRWLRSCNVHACGWPPPYLDADGDFKPEKSDD